MNKQPYAGLLPCPFCGGDDIFMEPDEYGSGGQWVYPIHVGCSRCKVEIVCIESDTIEEAVAAWNKRADGPEAAEAISSLLKALTATREGWVNLLTVVKELNRPGQDLVESYIEIIDAALNSDAPLSIGEGL